MSRIDLVRNIRERFDPAFALSHRFGGVGTPVEGLRTSAEAIMAAGLDWEVTKERQSYLWKSENRDSRDYALIRSDNGHQLGTVGSRYNIFQNHEAFEFFDAIVGEGRAIYDRAGEMAGGERVFVTAKLNPEDFKKRANDVIEHYVMLFNSFTGKLKLTLCGLGNRLTCSNQISGILGRARNVFRIPHLGSLHDRVDQAREALGIVTLQMRELEKVLDELRAIKMSERELQAFAYKVTPDREPEQEAVRYLFTNGMGCEGKNRYDAFNAVTQFTTHHLNVRGGTDEIKAEKRFSQCVIGRGHRMQQRALALLLP